MSRRLVPLLDRILVAKVSAPAKTSGGVLIPETAVNKVRGINAAVAKHGRAVAQLARGHSASGNKDLSSLGSRSVTRNYPG